MSEISPMAAQTIIKMNEVNPKLKEREFVEKWLLTLYEYIGGGEVEIGIWLTNQGVTIYGEVDVVDDSGSTIFVVPSIMMTQDKVLPSAVASEVSDIVYRADILNRRIPGKGDEYIRNEIIGNVKPSTNLQLYQDRWDNIFVKYNLEPIFSKSVTISNTPIDDDEEFDDYEEL